MRVLIKKRFCLLLFAAALTVFMTVLCSAASAGPAVSVFESSLEELTGFGGAQYFKKAGYYVNIYGPGGEIAEVRYKSGGSRQRLYVLNDVQNGRKHYAYCLASGLAFRSESGYEGGTGVNGDFSSYYDVLPEAAKKGIAYASILGYSEEKMSMNGPGPLPGTLGSDFWVATQCVIWEYQQGIRTDAVSRMTSGRIEEDNYYSVVRGKPAEKCYDYLLGLIRSYSELPPFLNAGPAGWSETLTLDETFSGSGIYRKSFYDAGGLSSGDFYAEDENGNRLEWLKFIKEGSYIKVESTRRITASVKVIIRRSNTDNEGSALLFAPDDPGCQPMLSTAGRLQDPFAVYMRINTRNKNSRVIEVNISKSSDNGVISGIPFIVVWQDHAGNVINRTVYTDERGGIRINIPLGGGDGELTPNSTGFAVAELSQDKYVPSLESYNGDGFITNTFLYRIADGDGYKWTHSAFYEYALSGSADGMILKGHSATVISPDANTRLTFNYLNTQKKGGARLIKTSESGQVDGFVFELAGAERDNAGVVIRRTTGAGGIAEWEGLMPGTYTVREIHEDGGLWEDTGPVTVNIRADATAEIRFNNVYRSGEILIVKTAEDDRFDGVSFTVTGPGGYMGKVLPDEDSVVSHEGEMAFVALIDGLRPGEYVIREEHGGRYVRKEPVTVTVSPGKTSKVSIRNELARVGIRIVKSIYAAEFVPAHGNAVFIFRITGIDSGRVYHRYVEFTADDLREAGAGAELLTKSFFLDGLPAGKYRAEELKTIRYEQESVTVLRGGRAEGRAAVFELTADETLAEAAFVNRVINQERSSHTALCVNIFGLK